MGTHRRKWGWWLVAALAVALVTGLLLRKCSDTSSGPSPSTPSVPSDSARSGPVVRDTMYVNVDGTKVPVVRERKVEAGNEEGEAVTSSETVLLVPVKEIAGIIRGKGGPGFSLTTQAPDRISVAYSGKVDIPMLGEQDMDLTADFKVLEVDGDRLVLQIDSGVAKNLVADLFSAVLVDQLPKGLVESFSNGRAVVNLSAVPQLKRRLKGLDLVGFSVDEEGLWLKAVEK